MTMGSRDDAFDDDDGRDRSGDYTVTREQTARLARSLRTFSTIPRAIAEAHIRLRGYAVEDDGAAARGGGDDNDDDDDADARVRGQLFKVLSDEVLKEHAARRRGEVFHPYVNARGATKGGGGATTQATRARGGRAEERESGDAGGWR